MITGKKSSKKNRYIFSSKKINHILKSIFYCINDSPTHIPPPSNYITDLPSEMERLGIIEIWSRSLNTVDHTNIRDISFADKNKLYMSEFINNIKPMIIDVENIITFN